MYTLLIFVVMVSLPLPCWKTLSCRVSYNFPYYYLGIGTEDLYLPIGMTRLLPPFPLLRRAEPPLCVTKLEQNVC